MYIGYLNNRQELGFLCLKDIDAGNQMRLILRTGGIYITIFGETFS